MELFFDPLEKIASDSIVLTRGLGMIPIFQKKNQVDIFSLSLKVAKYLYSLQMLFFNSMRAPVTSSLLSEGTGACT